MQGILKLFFNDIKAAASHFFVLAIVIGIAVLPALYAWVNIYANGNPYENTKNIRIAVASRDKGLTLSKGRYVNSAEEMMDEMSESDTIEWHIVKHPKKAVAGVRSGKYYAAVIFRKGFTRDMHRFKHVLSAKKAPIVYYSNTKKNAVAAKITDSAVTSLVARINKKYVRTMLRQGFKDEKAFSREMHPGKTINDTLAHLSALRENIAAYRAAIDQLTAAGEGTKSSLEAARQKLRAENGRIRSSLRRVEQNYRDTINSLKNTPTLTDDSGSSSLSVDYSVLADEMNAAYGQLKPLLDSAGTTADSMDPVLASAEDATSALEVSLQQLTATLDSLNKKLDDMTALLQKAKKARRHEKKIFNKKGNAKRYGSFFASPVKITLHRIYSVPTYGAAMTPFYTVLALWVGAVILVSLLKTHVDRNQYPDLTEVQCYFGRFLIFALLGQLQAAIIVAGDIYLLHCRPVHPDLMWGAAAMTSLVFVLLIYSITLSFGDIGKGIIVVVMVLQIAGSGGSYPIEILPGVFERIYRFFPFPYALGAIREALCGTWQHDYALYLAKLSVFLAVGLFVGLVIRTDFIGIDHFVREKLEESEVL